MPNVDSPALVELLGEELTADLVRSFGSVSALAAVPSLSHSLFEKHDLVSQVPDAAHKVRIQRRLAAKAMMAARFDAQTASSERFALISDEEKESAIERCRSFARGLRGDIEGAVDRFTAGNPVPTVKEIRIPEPKKSRKRAGQKLARAKKKWAVSPAAAAANVLSFAGGNTGYAEGIHESATLDDEFEGPANLRAAVEAVEAAPEAKRSSQPLSRAARASLLKQEEVAAQRDKDLFGGVAGGSDDEGPGGGAGVMRRRLAGLRGGPDGAITKQTLGGAVTAHVGSGVATQGGAVTSSVGGVGSRRVAQGGSSTVLGGGVGGAATSLMFGGDGGFLITTSAPGTAGQGR